MRNHSIPFVIVAALAGAALSSTACDSENETRRGPLQPSGISSFASTPELAMSIGPTPVVRRRAVGGLCPIHHPFFVPLELLVGNTSQSTVFLSGVEFQFVDSAGVAGPQVATGQPNLDRQFGQRVGVPPQSSHAFPFSVEFGCGTLPTGSINVTVETTDKRHGPKKRSFTVPVH